MEIKSFSGIEPGCIDEKMLEKNFIKDDFGNGEIFFVSKEIYHHDINNEDDGDFEYRYVIAIEDYGIYGDMEMFAVGLAMIPLTRYILNELESMGYENLKTGDSEEDILHSESFAIEAMREGYSILFGNESFDYTSDDDESVKKQFELANESALVAANSVNCINSLRGFYLDRCVNRIGTTGWDMLGEYVYDKGNAFAATLERYK